MSGTAAVFLRSTAVDQASYAFRSYSRCHCPSQTLFSTHISCRLRHFASSPLANLKGKGGRGKMGKKTWRKMRRRRRERRDRQDQWSGKKGGAERALIGETAHVSQNEKGKSGGGGDNKQGSAVFLDRRVYRQANRTGAVTIAAARNCPPDCCAQSAALGSPARHWRTLGCVQRGGPGMSAQVVAASLQQQ